MARPILLQNIDNITDANTRQDSELESLRNRDIELDLVNRYHVPTVSRSTGNSSVLTTNPIPTTWTGSDKSYSNGQYTIEATVTPSGANPLSNAFNGNTTDGYMALANTTVETAIILTLPEAITVHSFRTYIPDRNGVDSVTIQGSTNKSSWTRLYYYSNFDSALTTRNLETTGAYKYYRFLYSLDSSTTVEIREIQIGSYTIPTITNNFNISYLPSTVKTNQRIMLKTPDFSNTGVSANKLNNVDIDMLLLPNRFYELVYDGTKYLSKEVV